eukprot:524891-Rhodomonas_salina.1
MGRPCASPLNRAFVRHFASACTTFTNNKYDLIARSGPYSLFAALAQCFPSVVRTEQTARSENRNGVSEAECNKELQGAGFRRVRDRRTAAKRQDVDPEGSGVYIFCGFAWRDPSNEEDLEFMQSAWKKVCTEYPSLAPECPFEMFTDVIRLTVAGWTPKAGFLRRKRRIDPSHSLSEAASVASASSTQCSPCPSPANAHCDESRSNKRQLQDCCAPNQAGSGVNEVKRPRRESLDFNITPKTLVAFDDPFAIEETTELLLPTLYSDHPAFVDGPEYTKFFF